MIAELSRLKQIGLTEGELKVYEALLKIGESTKTALAKTSGVAPANLYDITNRLSETGVISIVEKNGVKHFAAANPRHLLDFLEQKKKGLEQEEELVKSILPSLQAAFAERSTGTKVEVFTGWPGLKTVFEDVLAECMDGDHNYVYGASTGESAQRADTFFLKYSRMRARKGIMLNILFNESVKERKERISFFLESWHCNVKFLEQHTNTEIMLYNDVAVILILAREPMAIRMRDRNVFSSFKQHFDALWALAKP